MSQGTVKCEHWARNQCLAGSVCLACSSFLGTTRRWEAGGGVGERWHRAWTDTQINNTMCGQTASLSVGCHLLHCGTPLTNTLALCLHAHISHANGLWMIAWSSLLFPLHMSHEFFKPPPLFFYLFCPLLQLALMEAIRARDGEGDRVQLGCESVCAIFTFLLVPEYEILCFCFLGNMVCSWCLPNGHATRTHREACISASKLFMPLWYCTPDSGLDINKSFKCVYVCVRLTFY